MAPISKQIKTATVSHESAEKAVRNARFITPDNDLQALASQWSEPPAIGLDTEFVRERTFYPRPGLVQISNGQSIWLLDPVDREDFISFGEVLDNANVIKILHSAGEDLEVFRLLTNTVPAPLFDTQIAAAMIGFPLQCRYESLVEQCFGITLPGGQARSNWCRRPLPGHLLEYAAQDVIWLPRLQEMLSEELDKSNRLGWLTEDCHRMIQSESESPPPVVRIKGSGKLDDQRLAWLSQLADWREQQAHQHDLPRGFILRDETMISLVETAGEQKQLKNILGSLPHPVRRRHGEQLLDMLMGPEPDAVERPPELTGLDIEQRQRLKEAQATVRSIAEDLNIDPALIASKRELTRLIRGERPGWMEGWRGKLLGDLNPI